jgi:hypothetical protein
LTDEHAPDGSEKSRGKPAVSNYYGPTKAKTGYAEVITNKNNKIHAEV